MDVGRKVASVLAVNMAAVSGASVGNELGAFVRDQLEARRLRDQGLPEPEKRVYLQTLGQNAPATVTLVAMGIGLLAPRRRPLWAFTTAAVLAALVGNRFDGVLLRPASQEETTHSPQESENGRSENLSTIS
jgi:hypothetical protein